MKNKERIEQEIEKQQKVNGQQDKVFNRNADSLHGFEEQPDWRDTQHKKKKNREHCRDDPQPNGRNQHKKNKSRRK